MAYGVADQLGWLLLSFSDEAEPLLKTLKLSQRPPKIPYVKNQACYNSSKRGENSSFAPKTLCPVI